MNSIFKKLEASPLLARFVPYAIFVALTFCQGKFGEASRYWFYFAKTIVGAWLIWFMRPLIAEMKWKFSWESVVVGVAVFVIWVGVDDFYPKFGKSGDEWNPNKTFGQSSAWAWMFIVVRTLGSSIVVPPLEEVFYRSLVYRYIAKPDFQSFEKMCFPCSSAAINDLMLTRLQHFWINCFHESSVEVR